MARWITIRTPFDFTWPSRAITHYSQPGEQFVKDEVADFAVGKGFATEGKADGSEATAPKRKRRRATSTKKAAKTVADAAPADTGRAETVDRQSDADDGGAAHVGALDTDAG